MKRIPNYTIAFDHVQCPNCHRAVLAMSRGESRICPMCGNEFTNPNAIGAANTLTFAGKNADMESYLKSPKFEEEFTEAVKEKSEVQRRN